MVLKGDLMKKLVIVFILIAIVAAVACVENMVKVCDVAYTNDLEKEYANIASSNYNSDCLLIRRQAVTEGTEYYIQNSTDVQKIEPDRDIILYDWINPAFLKVNDDFALLQQAEYVVLVSRNDIVKKQNKYNEDIVRVKPEKIIMLTKSDEIYNHSKGGVFYVNDLSLTGHIRFYLGLVLPAFRESV